MSADQELPWTGERLVPQYTGGTALEHLHRYAFARDLVHGKAVLDIASGEGYGSKILATCAKSVIGVDISEQAVDHANAKYGYAAEFRVGSCIDIPVTDSSIDVLVTFETLEHIGEHEQFLAEIRRVLIPGGVLVISTPDKLHYTIGQKFLNEYHVRELSKEAFVALIQASFKNSILFEQAIVAGSAIAPCYGNVPSGIRHYLGNYNGLTYTDGLMAAPYLIMVASDGALPVDPAVSLFKGWDIPTEEEKLLADARKTLASERHATDMRISQIHAEHASMLEQVFSAHGTIDAILQLELKQLREAVQGLAAAQSELEMLRGEHLQTITAHQEEVMRLTATIETAGLSALNKPAKAELEPEQAQLTRGKKPLKRRPII